MHPLIPGVLARHNKQNGRSEGSRIDLEVYCPPGVLQVDGPLYGDTMGIQGAHDLFMSEQIANIKLSMYKCTTCGFPDCDCNACGDINRARGTTKKTKTTSRHSCALMHVVGNGGAPPPKGWYDVELNSQLKIAWGEKGISPAPVFSKQHRPSGYFWPEELEGLTCKVSLAPMHQLTV